MGETPSRELQRPDGNAQPQIRRSMHRRRRNEFLKDQLERHINELAQAKTSVDQIKDKLSHALLDHRDVAVCYIELSGLLEDFFEISKGFYNKSSGGPQAAASPHPTADDSFAPAGDSVQAQKILQRLANLEQLQIGLFKTESQAAQCDMQKALCDIQKALVGIQKAQSNMKNSHNEMHQTQERLIRKLESMDETSQAEAKSLSDRMSKVESACHDLSADVDNLVKLRKVLNSLHLRAQQRHELQKKLQELQDKVDGAGIPGLNTKMKGATAVAPHPGLSNLTFHARTDKVKVYGGAFIPLETRIVYWGCLYDEDEDEVEVEISGEYEVKLMWRQGGNRWIKMAVDVITPTDDGDEREDFGVGKTRRKDDVCVGTEKIYINKGDLVKVWATGQSVAYDVEFQMRLI